MMMTYIIALAILVLFMGCVVTCFLCRSGPKKKKEIEEIKDEVKPRRSVNRESDVQRLEPRPSI